MFFFYVSNCLSGDIFAALHGKVRRVHEVGALNEYLIFSRTVFIGSIVTTSNVRCEVFTRFGLRNFKLGLNDHSSLSLSNVH